MSVYYVMFCSIPGTVHVGPLKISIGKILKEFFSCSPVLPCRYDKTFKERLKIKIL